MRETLRFFSGHDQAMCAILVTDKLQQESAEPGWTSWKLSSARHMEAFVRAANAVLMLQVRSKTRARIGARICAVCPPVDASDRADAVSEK
jgi:hypothetical protein